MAKRAKKEPDFHLKMKYRDGPTAAKVGVGWINKKGGINVKLSLGITISYRDDDDYILTLWPNNAIAEAMVNMLSEDEEGDG